jgi:calcineurin-like phosphoesterase family protein
MTKPTVWLTSDWHFGHRGVTQFEKGSKPVRPWDNPNDMDEAMVELHNSVVKPGDKVYHLGDAVINRRCLPTIGRLNGDKILIKGNHDVFRVEEYTPYFKDIRGVGQLADFVLTHVPVHPNELAPMGRWRGNIHGHLHTDRVMKVRWYRDEEGEWNTVTDTIDPLYLCVSMEQINFTPISLDEVISRWEKQQ